MVSPGCSYSNTAAGLHAQTYYSPLQATFAFGTGTHHPVLVSVAILRASPDVCDAFSAGTGSVTRTQRTAPLQWSQTLSTSSGILLAPTSRQASCSSINKCPQSIVSCLNQAHINSCTRICLDSELVNPRPHQAGWTAGRHLAAQVL